MKWIEDRREHLVAANHSREQYYRIRAAFDESGRLLAVDGEFFHDQGAYVRTHAATVADLAATMLLDSGDYAGLLDKALAAAGWLTLRGDLKRRRAAGEAVGAGLAFFVEKSGLGPYVTVHAGIDMSGTVEIVTGASCMDRRTASRSGWAHLHATTVTENIARNAAMISTLRFGRDEMRHFRRARQMEPMHALLHQPIGIGDALVLAQMLHPGLHQECLDHPACYGRIFEYAHA